MYLIWPSHEISGETGYTLPYSGNLFYNLVHKRDQSTSKLGHFFWRLEAEAGFIILHVAALIEGIAYFAFGICAAIFSSEKETERRVVIFACSILTSIYSLYSIFLNLFVSNLSSYVFHFDLFLRPYAHQSFFLDACRMGSLEAVQKLYDLKLDPHQRNAFGITPALHAHIYGHEAIEKIFPCNNYEQEYLEAKLLSHWLNLTGSITLDNQQINLYGAISNWMFYSIGQALNHFRHKGKLKGFSLSPTQSEKLEKAFLDAYHPRSSKAIAEQIQSGELCLLDAGWEEHAVCLVFYNGLLAICNRGEGTENFDSIEVFRINSSLVSERIIETIKTFASRETGMGLAYLYHALPGLLSPTGDPLKDEICHLFKEITPHLAKSGNCSLTAKKAALRFCWICLLQKQITKKTLRQGTKESKLFTDWAASYYFQTIKPHDKFYSMGEKDREDFLQQARQAYRKKTDRYQKNLSLLKV